MANITMCDVVGISNSDNTFLVVTLHRFPELAQVASRGRILCIVFLQTIACLLCRRIYFAVDDLHEVIGFFIQAEALGDIHSLLIGKSKSQ